MFTKRKTFHQKRDSLTVICTSTSEPKSYVLFIMHLSTHTQHIHGVYVCVCVFRHSDLYFGIKYFSIKQEHGILFVILVKDSYDIAVGIL